MGANMEFLLRATVASDLEVFFLNQLDEESNQMAAFTSADPTDKKAYIEKWTRLLSDETVHMRTIIYNDEIAGTVAKYEMDGESEITYWIGKRYWGRGVASKAVEAFLRLEKSRPIYGRVAFDNTKSLRVLEKSGFVKIGSELSYANARGTEIEEFIYRLN
ncbi:MAG: GNAT family N-acetyltransferase [Clostridiales bacterium]|jgi:RimJ/RimL family protein N-acetyltransferase|nr:GNAT family N-acetyltransferase [Clostridiales bacterium]